MMPRDLVNFYVINISQPFPFQDRNRLQVSH